VNREQVTETIKISTAPSGVFKIRQHIESPNNGRCYNNSGLVLSRPVGEEQEAQGIQPGHCGQPICSPSNPDFFSLFYFFCFSFLYLLFLD